jgi:uncharacterized membrane protein YhaH (DUF805 family)
MNWYLQVFRKYADFSGRARRKEYWMFALFNLFACIIAVVLDLAFGTNFKFLSQPLPYGYIYVLYCLVILLPSLAVSVRRLHDTGRSGWMLLISLIPIVGGIWLFVLLVLDSQQGANEYGLNPKEITVTSN